MQFQIFEKLRTEGDSPLLQKKLDCEKSFGNMT